MASVGLNSAILALFSLAILSCSGETLLAAQPHDDFLECLSLHSFNSNSIYTPINSSFLTVLQSSINNLRFNSSTSVPKPQVIVTPSDESQIQVVITCAKKTGIQIRTRSGGHDYEGLSYTSATSRVPFIILDLINLSEITVDADSKTAWVQAGATVGQLNYRIAEKSKTLAFPAGISSTIGVGGHFSGGGYGILVRKYGLASDHIVDARIVDVKGRILDRESMGEDLFWAIRGAGMASFGVITAYKVNLVTVPEIISMASVARTLEENATELIYEWQSVAAAHPKDVSMGMSVRKATLSSGEKTLRATFAASFLGPADGLVEVLDQTFPELGVKREDCMELSWIQLVLLTSGYSTDASPEVLADRTSQTTWSFKAKSDYVQEPIPVSGLEGIWKIFFEEGGDPSELGFIAYGGIMDEISESETPYPHRKGNLYKIQHYTHWDEAGDSEKYLSWIRKVYDFMAPYVSKKPRGAYANFRDLDIGVNNDEGPISYRQARVWGRKYFKDNFKRLVRIKTKVDPDNFFRNEQSIPPFVSGKEGNQKKFISLLKTATDA